ncbi:S-layer homology domain-containing protein [Paenibacillus sp. y28]|uniref:S-layer homology domain-containing protein n=1 Tax=Paenibacillus sp. y28 TaxID=3129110 RepID=UPI00301A5142
MKKMLFSTVLSLSLIVPVAGQALAADAFTDLASSSAKTQIEALKEKGIVSGVTDSEFQPTAALTASQGISMIVKGMQLSLAAVDFNKAPTAEGFFSKIKNTDWYAEPFVIAHANLADFPADIDPSKPMTKEQFVTYLVQALEKTGEYALIKIYIPVADENELTLPNGPIQRSLIYKIAALDEKANFNPQHIVTREEAAAMLYNAVQFVEEHKERLQAIQAGENTDGAPSDSVQSDSVVELETGSSKAAE